MAPRASSSATSGPGPGSATVTTLSRASAPTDSSSTRSEPYNSAEGCTTSIAGRRTGRRGGPSRSTGSTAARPASAPRAAAPSSRGRLQELAAAAAQQDLPAHRGSGQDPAEQPTAVEVPRREEQPVAAVVAVVEGGLGPALAGSVRATLVVHRDEVLAQDDRGARGDRPEAEVDVLPVEEVALVVPTDAGQQLFVHDDAGAAEPVPGVVGAQAVALRPAPHPAVGKVGARSAEHHLPGGGDQLGADERQGLAQALRPQLGDEAGVIRASGLRKRKVRHPSSRAAATPALQAAPKPRLSGMPTTCQPCVSPSSSTARR